MARLAGVIAEHKSEIGRRRRQLQRAAADLADLRARHPHVAAIR